MACVAVVVRQGEFDVVFVATPIVPVKVEDDIVIRFTGYESAVSLTVLCIAFEKQKLRHTVDSGKYVESAAGTVVVMEVELPSCGLCCGCEQQQAQDKEK